MHIHVLTGLLFLTLFSAQGLRAQGSDAPPATQTEPANLLPCPEDYNCQADPVLIGLMTQLDLALSQMTADQPQPIITLIQKMGASEDPRLLPVYERLLKGPNALISVACLKALSPISQYPPAQQIAHQTLAQTNDPLILGAALNLLFEKKVTEQFTELPCPPEGQCAGDSQVLKAMMDLQSNDNQQRQKAIEDFEQLTQLIDPDIQKDYPNIDDIKNKRNALLQEYKTQKEKYDQVVNFNKQVGRVYFSLKL